MIFEYAARPTFDQADLYDARSPYSSAIALCRVFKIVRRVVLPELLHTILLPDFRHVAKFVHALRMQKSTRKKEMTSILSTQPVCIRCGLYPMVHQLTCPTPPGPMH